MKWPFAGSTVRIWSFAVCLRVFCSKWNPLSIEFASVFTKWFIFNGLNTSYWSFCSCCEVSCSFWKLRTKKQTDAYCFRLYLIIKLFSSLSPQTVNQRIWRLTRSRRRSSLTLHWRRLDAGSSHTTFSWPRRSWPCGKRTQRASVMAYRHTHRRDVQS